MTAFPSAPHSVELAKATHLLAATAQYPILGVIQAVFEHVLYPAAQAVHTFVSYQYPSTQAVHFSPVASFVLQPFYPVTHVLEALTQSYDNVQSG